MSIGRQTQRKSGAFGEGRRSRQKQQAPSEATLQPQHARAMPHSIASLHLDHLSRMLAQQHSQLRALRFIPLVKDDDCDLKIAVGVSFKGAAGDGAGLRRSGRHGLRPRQNGRDQKQHGDTVSDDFRWHPAILGAAWAANQCRPRRLRTFRPYGIVRNITTSWRSRGEACFRR